MSKDKFPKGTASAFRWLSMFKEVGLQNSFLYNVDNGDSGGELVYV